MVGRGSRADPFPSICSVLRPCASLAVSILSRAVCPDSSGHERRAVQRPHPPAVACSSRLGTSCPSLHSDSPPVVLSASRSACERTPPYSPLLYRRKLPADYRIHPVSRCPRHSRRRLLGQILSIRIPPPQHWAPGVLLSGACIACIIRYCAIQQSRAVLCLAQRWKPRLRGSLPIPRCHIAPFCPSQHDAQSAWSTYPIPRLCLRRILALPRHRWVYHRVGCREPPSQPAARVAQNGCSEHPLGDQSRKALLLDLLGGQSHSKGQLLFCAPRLSMQPVQHRGNKRITRADGAAATQRHR